MKKTTKTTRKIHGLDRIVCDLRCIDITIQMDVRVKMSFDTSKSVSVLRLYNNNLVLFHIIRKTLLITHLLVIFILRKSNFILLNEHFSFVKDRIVLFSWWKMNDIEPDLIYKYLFVNNPLLKVKKIKNTRKKLWIQ